mgnify:CR=1
MQDATNKPWLMLECLVEFSSMVLNNSFKEMSCPVMVLMYHFASALDLIIYN